MTLWEVSMCPSNHCQVTVEPRRIVTFEGWIAMSLRRTVVFAAVGSAVFVWVVPGPVVLDPEPHPDRPTAMNIPVAHIAVSPAKVTWRRLDLVVGMLHLSRIVEDRGIAHRCSRSGSTMDHCFAAKLFEHPR